MNSREAKASRALQDCITPVAITKVQLNDFLSLRELEGICGDWLQGIERYLTSYLKYINWRVDRTPTLRYLKKELDKCSISTYRKKTYQIKKFLNYCRVSWANDIKLPKEPETTIKRITIEDIAETIRILKSKRESTRYIALVLLGASTGLRAEEIYQLKPRDIDIDNRIIQVKHDPVNGQTTKTKKSRIAFFNEEAKHEMGNYLRIYKSVNRFAHLFTKSQCIVALKNTPIRVKDLRKYFSQEWDRRGGPTSIKKILMGHSLKGDVDLMHYNYQSEDDLKKIYDKVMGNGTEIGIL